MANGKQRLQGLIGTGVPLQKGAPYTVSSPDAEGQEPVPTTTTLQRGAPFTISTADDVDIPLSDAVLSLREELQALARNYIGARRRSGKALLEAARWLREARVAADHGEWYAFLEATETSTDTAERLLRIYELAMQHPAFGSAVAEGRLSQSTAERLARESTPFEVIEVVLTAEKPPTVAEVDRAIRAAKRASVESGRAAGPQPLPADRAEGATPRVALLASGGLDPASPDALPMQLALQEIATILAELAQHAEQFTLNEASTQALQSIEQSLAILKAARSKQ
ncbi:DUF3102 domain-containing protein [Candidatus Chloroploca sp. Khr17]|uniref:DUF3102 domain-containing protein n=1 Tax=Candidatus Chloroploca sp. Khr17 TaxID=2496869 RepID=UPI00101D9B48|nr:DUF3102 domain-containing protein [Candidatus Chloroploca sp. Khr17]